jgi:hypothetical protein
MRKFSKILESFESDIVLDIRDIFIDFKDAGFKIEIEDWSKENGFIDISLKYDGKTDTMECIRDLSVADNRIKDLGLSYEDSTIEINHNGVNIKMRYKLVDSVANKDVYGWKEFKSYCEKVLGIEGMEGRDPLYFRINVVDKDNGWPGLPDDKAGWSIETDEDSDSFVAAFPGYEDFTKKLLSRQINYNLVWHLVSDENDRHNRQHIISDPVKLEDAKKKHNPMKFDKEGIEAVETLIEMAKKFPNKIKIKKHKI